jgi:hypothetical protein
MAWLMIPEGGRKGARATYALSQRWHVCDMFKLHHLVLGNGYISPPFRLTEAAQKFSSSANGNIGLHGHKSCW